MSGQEDVRQHARFCKGFLGFLGFLGLLELWDVCQAPADSSKAVDLQDGCQPFVHIQWMVSDIKQARLKRVPYHNQQLVLHCLESAEAPKHEGELAGDQYCKLSPEPEEQAVHQR
jgi:hypothetical protein